MAKEITYLPDDEEARNHPLRKYRHWTLRVVDDQPAFRLYDADPPLRAAYLCPSCTEKARRKEWRRSEINYIDLPRSGKHVELRIRFGRFRCVNTQCSISAFTERLDEVDPRHHITTDLKDEILGYLRRKGTFSEGARAYGLNEQTLRKLEAEFVEAEDARRIAEHTLRLPLRLGLHLCRLAGKSCCLLTNMDTHRALEFIPFKQYKEIVSHVQGLFDPIEQARVGVISIPLNKEFRAVANELFSRATIFVPRHELETVANEHLKAIVTRSRLEKWKLSEVLDAICSKRLTKAQERMLRQLFEVNPGLKQSHEQKRSLLEAYRLKNSDEKRHRLAVWVEEFMKTSKRKDHVELLSAREWQEAITNGMNEAYTDYFIRIQRLIAELNRAGRGYSLATIRGRVLYGDGLPTALPIKARSKFGSQPALFEDRAAVEERGSSIERLITLFSDWTADMSPKKTKRF
jgi:hypothetical protein